MELLIGAIVVVLASSFKLLVEKWGFEKAKAFVLLVAFVLSFAGFCAWKIIAGEFVLSWENAADFWKIFGSQMAFYEMLVKRLLIPIFNKSTK